MGSPSVSDKNTKELFYFTINDNPSDKIEPKWKKSLTKIWRVASIILLVLVNVALFLSNPYLYPIAFFVGFVFNKQAQQVIDKITVIWKKQPWPMTIGIGLATAVTGFLSIHIALAIASGLFAAPLGATLSQKAENLLEEKS